MSVGRAILGLISEFKRASAELGDELRRLITVGKNDYTQLLFGQQ